LLLLRFGRMKMTLTRIALLEAALMAGGASAANPLGEVISLMNELAAKVTKDKEAEAKAYKEYFEWCDDVSKNKKNEITTATARGNSRQQSKS